MKLLAVLACLLAGCLAQKPRPCSSPPLLSGALTVTAESEQLWSYAKYLYDALGRRIRLYEFGSQGNETFTFDVLLLYKEATMYEIFSNNRTCIKRPLKGDFQPLRVPKSSVLLAQSVLGSSSGPGQGLLVNSWIGNMPSKAGKYVMTVTEFGCIPVSTVFVTEKPTWILTSFFNNVIGISEPGQLVPPDFCPGADAKHSTEEPADFYSSFLKKH